jgi:serine/threonine protein kinase
MGTRQIGNYRVIEYVGSGGFGSVFKAEDCTSPGRIVAIKELHRKHTRSAVMKQRFFQEALAMARLDHPNLPRLYTFGEDNGSYYLVMEFVSGIPLSDEIEQNGAIQAERATQIMIQVVEAVGYAHRNGIIHRDLKPDNIILTKNRDELNVKVLDFGIAKLIGGENLTLTGEGFGTPSYMSPERIAGSSDLDRRTDIYSLGIILFQMLTGRVPFESTSTDPAIYWTEMRRMHSTEPLPPLSDFGVPEQLENIVRKAAAKLAEDRYRTPDEMLAALRGGEVSAGLLLTTMPASAEVYVDNILRGTSDATRGKILIEGLTAGLHNVKVSKAGYNSYKLDVSLETGRVAELQVQLPARATVAIPRNEVTSGSDLSTSKIQGGDDVKTAVLMPESVPAGSAVSTGTGQVMPGNEEGSATMMLGPGTEQLDVSSPSRETQKQFVAAGSGEIGSQKTVKMSPPFETQSRASGGPRAAASSPGATKPRLSRAAAAVVATLILTGLAVASFVVLRGPGRAKGQGPATSSVESADLAAGPTASSQTAPPANGRADQDAGAQSKDLTGTANKNADALEQAKKDIARLEKKLADEEKSSAQKKDAAPAPATTPVAPPEPPAPQLNTPQPGMSCVIVQVSGPGAQAMVGYHVDCVEQGDNTGSPMQAVHQGVTGPMGRWRQCGVRIGHRLLVRVTGPGGVSAGVKQQIVTKAQTFVDFQVGAEPDTAPSRPGRKPRFWQKPGE